MTVAALATHAKMVEPASTTCLTTHVETAQVSQERTVP